MAVDHEQRAEVRASIVQPVGLRFPDRLSDWQDWQARHRPLLQRLRASRQRSSRDFSPTNGVLTLGSPNADLLVVCDQDTPSLRSATIEPLRHIDPTRFAVLATRERSDLCGPGSAIHDVSNHAHIVALLPNLRLALTVGDHLPLGYLAHQAVGSVGGQMFVVQHGLLTPFSPPLDEGVTLLAWSEADGEFWRADRDDVSVEVVGSQLLWAAAEHPAQHVDPGERPVFLGQMHAAELSRAKLIKASVAFCRTTGARYRPHPSEVDKVSRLAHGVMHRAGISFDTNQCSLANLGAPVAAVFSSGILEAAAAGMPAWAYFPEAPAWVEQFWDRYEIARWGTEPTPAPTRPTIEPAERIAQVVTTSLGSK